MSNLSSEPNRHDRHDAAPWVLGGVLIMVGVFMLLSNIIGLDFGNWWALFILIPAIGALAKAWQIYQATGEIGEEVRGPLVAGLVLLVVFAMFFFGFSWALLWPVLLIVAGIGALVGVVGRR